MGKKRDHAVAHVIGEVLDRIQKRQREAQTAVDDALSMIKRGRTDQAVKALMDFEGPARDSLDLFNAALTIKREFTPATRARRPRRDD